MSLAKKIGLKKKETKKKKPTRLNDPRGEGSFPPRIPGKGVF